ncbi:hypothetical protein NPIL_249991 [Nephila pilipes]|uniref:Uncharacterized protein n=1 Tax=Nephila pilipes TaxID=299642 RepID=A0A8X6IU80_NEPPI|nr:hypothetical protein NPIL_249991 [Nephila pilipes]
MMTLLLRRVAIPTLDEVESFSVSNWVFHFCMMYERRAGKKNIVQTPLPIHWTFYKESQLRRDRVFYRRQDTIRSSPTGLLPQIQW